jgi:hypothetical protein
MVDAIVREWLRQVLDMDAARLGYGEAVRRFLAIFYANDGYVAARCPRELQTSMDILVGLFERVGLRTNTSKTKVMICVPGKIRTCLSGDVYNNSRAGLMARDEWHHRRVECDICGENLSAASLTSHLETRHDVFRSKVLQRDLGRDHTEAVFKATESASNGRYYCPVPGCEGWAGTKWNLRWHFSMRHPLDLVNIPGEGIYPRCNRCGMQVNPEARRHEQTKHCMEGFERKVQHEAAENSALALEEICTAYGEELERVEVFKYLGRLLGYNDNDVQTMQSNLKKARQCWARLSHVLRAENASPQVCGMFYKATVQAVLLFGSETWNLTPSSIKRLEGFHLQAARRITGKMPCKNPDGMWTYPLTEDVLEAAGLYTITHYVGVRRQTIANFIVNRPIFELCRGVERKRGTSNRQYWGEQPMDFEAARANAVVAADDDAEDDTQP